MRNFASLTKVQPDGATLRMVACQGVRCGLFELDSEAITWRLLSKWQGENIEGACKVKDDIAVIGKRGTVAAIDSTGIVRKMKLPEFDTLDIIVGIAALSTDRLVVAAGTQYWLIDAVEMLSLRKYSIRKLNNSGAMNQLAQFYDGNVYLCSPYTILLNPKLVANGAQIRMNRITDSHRLGSMGIMKVFEDKFAIWCRFSDGDGNPDGTDSGHFVGRIVDRRVEIVSPRGPDIWYDEYEPFIMHKGVAYFAGMQIASYQDGKWEIEFRGQARTPFRDFYITPNGDLLAIRKDGATYIRRAKGWKLLTHLEMPAK